MKVVFGSMDSNNKITLIHEISFELQEETIF